MPGQVLSFWRLVGRPMRATGYTEAAALKAGRLTEEIGGSICLASTVLYNVGLLAGMSIVERYCHSVDTYGDARYFELGRDAAVEYAYRDLRMSNEIDAPLAIRAGVCGGRVFAEAWSRPDLRLDVQLEVSSIAYVDGEAIEVRTWRTVSLDGRTWTDDLGLSHHDPPPA
jgi:vancomycin resistance protein VanW